MTPDTSAAKAGKTSRGLLSFLGSIIASSVFAAVMVGGIVLLHSHASGDLQPEPADPIVVATSTIETVSGYEHTRSYVGRLEPARQTAVAFERSGLVSQVIADEGDRINAGDVVARLDTARLETTRRQLLAQSRVFQAQRRLAKVTLERQRQLKTKGWSPDQRLDEAQSQFAALTANIERVAAEIAGIDVDIAKSTLKAPFAGTVAERSVDEGAVVQGGTPVLRLLETGSQQARIGLPPTVAQTIKADQKFVLRSGAQALPARLIAKRPDMESGTRTVTALFELESYEERASFGDLVTLDISTRVAEPGAWVPLTALKEGRRGLWTILTVRSDGGARVVAPEAVELLHARAGQAFVRGTFRNGAKFIAHGTGRVVPGQKIALAGE